MQTLMVVENDPHQRLLLQMELEDDGYCVVLADNGREALHGIKQECPDLVILDLQMPEMDGIAILGQLVDLRLPVIIYSSFGGLRDNYLTWMADAYLIKCSNLDPLKKEIRRVLLKREKDYREGRVVADA